ncbi:hypothetical protein [Mucilaginibacter sp.]|uniref:hypothetical protein n=1 Tax=Mucilaginibacter sp. TaxID=1882438 RepID=UPI0035BBA72F
MKKLSYIAKTVLLVFIGSIFFISSCKKKDESSISSGGCPNVTGGIGGNIGKKITFYTTKDFACGSVTLTGITLNKDGSNVSHSLQSNSRSMTKFYTVKPPCGSDGTVSVIVNKGYDYTYTFQCSSRTFTGTFYAECGDDCMLVEVK